MGYCFMSIEKIKDKGTMTRKYEHNYRTCYVPNADQDAIDQNEELVTLNGKTYKQVFNEKMNKLSEYNPKIRKNAVLGLEIITTFSREDRDNIDIEKWKKDQVDWLRETFNANNKYGDNVISVVFHGDEAGNVHCHSVVIPIDDKGKLNASYYLNGRKKMIQLQDSYGKKMNENHNLKRGLKQSSAKHKDIKYFYTALNQAYAEELPPVGKKGSRKETADEYRDRANEEYKILQSHLLNEKNKAERLRDEIKTINMNEKIDFYKEVEEFKKLNDIIDDENIDFKTLVAKANTMDKLNEGIKIYPNQQEALDTFSSIQKIIKHYEDIQEKEKKKKKQKKDKSDDIK